MASFHLAQAAYHDLEEIEQYTLETWGEAQSDLYLSGLFAAFAVISTQPGVGREREDVATGVRSFIHERHVVFYEEHEGVCFILRILHQRRDVASAFDP